MKSVDIWCHESQTNIPAIRNQINLSTTRTQQYVITPHFDAPLFPQVLRDDDALMYEDILIAIPTMTKEIVQSFRICAETHKYQLLDYNGFVIEAEAVPRFLQYHSCWLLTVKEDQQIHSKSYTNFNRDKLFEDLAQLKSYRAIITEAADVSRLFSFCEDSANIDDDNNNDDQVPAESGLIDLLSPVNIDNTEQRLRHQAQLNVRRKGEDVDSLKRFIEATAILVRKNKQIMSLKEQLIRTKQKLTEVQALNVELVCHNQKQALPSSPSKLDSQVEISLKKRKLDHSSINVKEANNLSGTAGLAKKCKLLEEQNDNQKKKLKEYHQLVLELEHKNMGLENELWAVKFEDTKVIGDE